MFRRISLPSNFNVLMNLVNLDDYLNNLYIVIRQITRKANKFRHWQKYNSAAVLSYRPQ